jgi:MFS family permease
MMDRMSGCPSQPREFASAYGKPVIDTTFDKRNYLLNAAEGALFISSGAFLSAQTVLPALVTRLGGTNVEVGALSVLVYAGLFLPQIFAARYVETLPRKKPWTMVFGMLHRSVVLIIGLVVMVFGGSDSRLALWLFLSLYLLQQILTGIATPGWFDLFAKLTPTNRRGRLIGIRTSIGGASAFVGSLALTWIFSRFEFPTSYALAFFFGFALQLSSWIVQFNLVEPEQSRTVQRRPMFAFLRAIPGVLRQNKAFGNFLGSSALLIVATMPVGFFTVYALKHFGAPEAVVGEFTLTIVAVQVVSALVNGYVADRFGNKAVLVIAAVCMLCASVVAVVASTLALYRMVFVFLGITLGSEVMARYNISVEYGPAEQRSTYIGMMNTLLAPFYFSGLLGGYLSDTVGFPLMFIIGGLFSLLGISLLLLKVQDPYSARTVVTRRT